jgi:hypothetical protein
MFLGMVLKRPRVISVVNGTDSHTFTKTDEMKDKGLFIEKSTVSPVSCLKKEKDQYPDKKARQPETVIYAGKNQLKHKINKIKLFSFVFL